MRLIITNKINFIPIFFNGIWLFLLAFIFFYRVPEYSNNKPEGASTLIFGTVMLSFFIFICSLIYMITANLYTKHKIYADMFYALIPIAFLILILFFR